MTRRVTRCPLNLESIIADIQGLTACEWPIRLDDGDEIAAITKLDIHDQETVGLNIPGEIGNPDLLNNGDEATGEAPEASGEDNQ